MLEEELDVSFVQTVLEKILSQPTAPYHEDFVARQIISLAKELNLEPELDNYGNIFIKYEPEGTEKNTLMVVSAHMDHPGFEVKKVDGSLVEAYFYGGVKAEYFKGTRVLLVPCENGSQHHNGKVSGEVIEFEEVTDAEEKVKVAKIKLDQPSERLKAGDFGTFDLPAFKEENGLIYTRAADDLGGCVVILGFLNELKRKDLKTRVWGIFTRAEEDRCAGAILTAKKENIPEHAKIITIETSKALPGAEIGKGVIIRVGDRLSLFDNDLEALFNSLKFEFEGKGIVDIQRQLMTGGVCESTFYFYAGYETMGLSIPLGNYHNMGDTKIEPEYISKKDLHSTIFLLLKASEKINNFNKNDFLNNLRKGVDLDWRTEKLIETRENFTVEPSA